MSKLEISTVASRSELAALASAWQALFDDDPLAGPFLSYLWLRRWLDVFAPQGDFRVELVHAGSRLVGGLWIHCRRRFGLRSWNLVGEAHACGEFLDFVALPDHRVAVADALARHLCSQTWDCLDLEGLAPHSALAKALAAEAADRGWSVGSRESQVCPTIERCDVAAFEAAPDAVFKRIVVKSERQVGKKVTLTYETSARPDATEPLAWLDDLIRWSIEGWRARGGASAFENDLLRDFYGRFTEDALAAGLVEMRRILADGVPAAMVYGLRRGSDFYFLQSGISPLGVRHKAGNILLNRTIRETLAAGGSFHFLRGDEIYKYRWGAVDVATQRLVGARPSTRGP